MIETILDTTDWAVVSLDRLDLSGKLNRSDSDDDDDDDDDDVDDTNDDAQAGGDAGREG